MFPHPCPQGVHLLYHTTTEHSADVCPDFHNFPILHVMVREEERKSAVVLLGKMADFTLTSSPCSCLILRVCVSLSLPVSGYLPSLTLSPLHTSAPRMCQLPCFPPGQQSKREINSLVRALGRLGYIHTHRRPHTPTHTGSGGLLQWSHRQF